MEPIKEGMHIYVSYAITLDTQQNSIEWTEGTLTWILIIEWTTIEITEGMRIHVMKVRKK